MPVPPVISGLGSRAADVAWGIPYGLTGIYQGIYNGVNIGMTTPVGGAVINTIGAAGAASAPGATTPVANAVFEFLRKYLGKFFVTGTSGIGSSNILGVLGNALQTNNFSALPAAMKAARIPGMMLLAAHPLVSIGAIALGGMLAYYEYQKTDAALKNLNTDKVNSALIHGIHSLCGVGTVIGGLVMWSNPLIGLGTIVTSFIGAKVMDGVEWFMGGANWLRYADAAPTPVNYAIKAFKRPSLHDGYVA